MYCFLALYLFLEVLCCLGCPLFYVTGEFHRLLLRG